MFDPMLGQGTSTPTPLTASPRAVPLYWLITPGITGLVVIFVLD